MKQTIGTDKTKSKNRRMGKSKQIQKIAITFTADIRLRNYLDGLKEDFKIYNFYEDVKDKFYHLKGKKWSIL